MSATGLRDGNFTEATEPLALFARWLDQAGMSEPNDPTAAALASVDGDGQPNVRMVLMKEFDARGFVFYTNFESIKGRELHLNPKAAMCFHWKSLRRQIRIRGPVEVVSAAEADAYYNSRPRGSRIGAWASDQSRPLDARRTLEERVEKLTREHGESDIPRPPHWSGFRIRPISIEFWQDGADRLHDRVIFTRSDPADEAWQRDRLYP